MLLGQRTRSIFTPCYLSPAIVAVLTSCVLACSATSSGESEREPGSAHLSRYVPDSCLVMEGEKEEKQSSEITGIIQLLDPEGRGNISFDDFCEGVRQIRETSNPDQNVSNSLDIFDVNALRTHPEPQEADVSDTVPSVQSFVDDLVNLDFSDHSYAEYDLKPDASFLTLPSEEEADSALSGKSSEIFDNGSRQEITDEENFEDFGEAESETSDQGRTTPVGLRKNKLGRPPRHHKRAWPNSRRITTTALASQLQKTAREYSPSSTRRSSFGSDEIFDDIDGNFQDLNERVKFLEKHLCRLNETQAKSDSKHMKLKEENSQLVQKVHGLEEMLREMEVRSDDKLEDERKRYQDLLVRQTRERSDHIDFLTQRLHQVEQENRTLTEDNTKIRKEKNELQAKYLEQQEQWEYLKEDNDRLKGENEDLSTAFDRERQTTGQLLDELGKELEDLRRYKIETEPVLNGRKQSISESARYKEVLAEVQRLREENRSLKDSNEDLSAQLVHKCMEEGRSLLAEDAGKSLADELNYLTKEELMEEINKAHETNTRLRAYVDKMLLTIMEKSPQLLEINH